MVKQHVALKFVIKICRKGFAGSSGLVEGPMGADSGPWKSGEFESFILLNAVDKCLPTKPFRDMSSLSHPIMIPPGCKYFGSMDFVF
jgi:hypothetical protein